MRILGIIPTRYASSRFPGKPLVEIHGKSMIQRVFEQAKRSVSLSEVVVATDDDRIFNEVLSFGGNAVMTRADHVSGTDRCFEALEKQADSYDAVLNIQGDEPFIDPAQINQLAGLLANDNTEISTLAAEISNTSDLFDQNCVKVVLDKNGKALYFSRQAIPFVRNADPATWLHHQTYYKHLGIYGYLTESLNQIVKMNPSSLEKSESLEQLRWLQNGLIIRVGITKTESIGIDTPEDLAKALKLFR